MKFEVFVFSFSFLYIFFNFQSSFIMSAKRPKPSLRDRTQEYRSLSTALRKRQQTNGAATDTHHTAKSAQSKAFYVEFSKQAGAIGNDIQGTTRILEQLATLARGKTIFDDKTAEINQLTTQVKQRIANINGKIMSLQTLQRQQNGTAAGSGGGGGGKQATEHHSNVVMSLQSQLATTSSVFKDVLELRSESLKESGSRKEQFIGSSAGNVPFRSTGKVFVAIHVLFFLVPPTYSWLHFCTYYIRRS